MTRRLTNSYTMHQTKQCSPVHHLYSSEISLWIKALTNNRKQHLTLMQPKNPTKSLQEIYLRLSSFNGCEESTHEESSCLCPHKFFQSICMNFRQITLTVYRSPATLKPTADPELRSCGMDGYLWAVSTISSRKPHIFEVV